MGISVAFFDSIDVLARYTEEKLKQANEAYSLYTRKIEDTRTIYTKDFPQKGSMKERSRSAIQKEIGGFKVLTNPTSEYELNILDEALKATQDRIDALMRVKRELLPSFKQNGRIAAIFEDEIPIAFMYYE
jgi:hypothetical protein